MIKILIAILAAITSVQQPETHHREPVEMYHTTEDIWETVEADPNIWDTVEADPTVWGTQNAPEATVATQPEEIPTEDTNGQSGAIYEPTTLPVTFESVGQDMQALYWSYAAYEPQEVIDALNAYNVQITVAPDGRYTHNHAGECVFRHGGGGGDFGVIKIGINASTQNRVAISVNHEIGHSLDEIIGMMAGMAQTTAAHNPYPTMTISNSPEFQAIYEAECVSAGYPNWNNRNTLEWFAETYRYVVEGNEEMRQRAPQSYEWVRQTVNAYLGTSL